MQLDEHELSTTCAFCDSPLVDTQAAEEPVDRVLPFVLDRDRAGRRLSKHLAGRLWAPDSLRRAARPSELRAVMVPFYTFDAITRTSFGADIGLYWYRTETYTTTEDGKTVTRTRQVRETEWHDLRGSHVGQWHDHLVSASRGLPEALANALEPFDLGRAKPYAPAMVAGVPAELPTIAHAEARATATQELRERAKAAVAGAHLPGDTSRGLSCQTAEELQDVQLVLLPVWIAVFDGPKGPVRMLVNGQTGEVVGSVPVSAAKIASAVAAAVLLVAGTAALAWGLG